MGFYELGQYREFERELDKFIDLNVNLEVVSVPGVGVSHYIKRFLERRRGKDVKYIVGPAEELGRFNILDLDWDKNEKAAGQVEDYMKKAGMEQKFAVVINTPNVLKTEAYKRSFLASRVYERYYFKARNKEDVMVYLADMGVKIGGVELGRVYELSGGVGRWVKLLAVHREWWGWTTEMILEKEEARQLVEPTAKVVGQCGEEILEKLGLKEKGKWTAELLAAYFEKYPLKAKILIGVEPDLTVVERGEPGVRLARVEAGIVGWMVDHEGVIEKEKVADFKWGEGGYDKFSDQAINKAMRRVSRKLRHYEIKALPGYGYKIVEKT